MVTILVASGALIGAIVLGALIAPFGRPTLPKSQWWGATAPCHCGDACYLPLMAAGRGEAGRTMAAASCAVGSLITNRAPLSTR